MPDRIGRKILSIILLTYIVIYASIARLKSSQTMLSTIKYLAFIRKILKTRHVWGYKLTMGLFLIVFTAQMLLPHSVTKAFSDEFISQIGSQVTGVTFYPNTFPESIVVPKWTIKVPMTAYNSEPGQTDDTPCIAARGYDLCAANEENVVAANFLPIGTKIKVPELYGDRIFTVVDRMNARYYYKVDFWMKEKSDAIKFGVKYATVEVY